MANRGADSSDQEGNKKKNEGKRVWNSCAACKHGEKMCSEGECEFAPHFPADWMEAFITLQRVLQNVNKMLKGTSDTVRGREMAKSLTWEANCWKSHPVHGPLGCRNSLLDHVRHLENQISKKDEEIQHLADVVVEKQQQLSSSSPGDRWAPMLFQENSTFQGGYMTPHHHLQEDHRAPMWLQENATFQDGYNVASSSTFSPDTADNQNPVVVQDLGHLHQEDQGNIGRNIGVGGLGYNNFVQGTGGSAGAAAMYDINNNDRGGICIDKDGNVNENPSRFGSGQNSSKKLWRDLFP